MTPGERRHRTRPSGAPTDAEIAAYLTRQLTSKADRVIVDPPAVVDLLLDARVRAGHQVPHRRGHPAFLAAAALLVVVVIAGVVVATGGREADPAREPHGAPGHRRWHPEHRVPPPGGARPLRLALDLDAPGMGDVELVEAVNQVDGTDPETLDATPTGSTTPVSLYRADPGDPSSPGFVLSWVDPAAISVLGGFEPLPGATVVELPDGRGWFDTLDLPTQKFAFERAGQRALVVGHGAPDDVLVEVARRAVWGDRTLTTEVDGYTFVETDETSTDPYAWLTYRVGELYIELRLSFGTPAQFAGQGLAWSHGTRSVPVRGTAAAVSDPIAGPIRVEAASASWYEAASATIVRIGITSDAPLTEPLTRLSARLDQALRAVVELDDESWAELVSTHPPLETRTWSCDPSPGACRRQALEDLDFCDDWQRQNSQSIRDALEEYNRVAEERSRQRDEAVARGEPVPPMSLPAPPDGCPRPEPPPHYRLL